MLAFAVVEFRDKFAPAFSVFLDGFHEQVVLFWSPLFINGGVDVVEPSFSAMFSIFEGSHVPSEIELLGYGSPGTYCSILLLPLIRQTFTQLVSDAEYDLIFRSI